MAAAGLVLLVAAGFLALRLEPEAGVEHAGGRRLTGLQADQGAAPPVRRGADPDPDPGQREPGPSARAAADGGSEADARPRGLPLRQPAAARQGTGPGLPGAGTAQADPGRVRARHLHQRVGATDRRPLQRRAPSRPQGGRQGRERRTQGGGGAGKSPAEQESLAAQARSLALAQSFQDALGLALRYGLSRVPQLNDPDFVLRLVFEPSLGFATPKLSIAYPFPTDRTALIQARLRPGLSDSEAAQGDRPRAAGVSSRAFRLERGDYRVSGEPVESRPLKRTSRRPLADAGRRRAACRRGADCGDEVTRRSTSSAARSVGALLAFAALSLLGGCSRWARSRHCR